MAKTTFNDLINSDKPVLIDFSAEWCGPCKMLKPILADLKKRMGEDAAIYKIDVDENPRLAEAYRIQSVPTLMIFQKGEMKWRQSGVLSAPQLEKVLRQFSVN